MSSKSSSFVLAAGIPSKEPVQAVIAADQGKSRDGSIEEFSAELRQLLDIQASTEPSLGEPPQNRLMNIISSWPAKFQDPSRGTCTAFNFLAQCEYLNKPVPAPKPQERFSEEYLYSKMRRELHDMAPPNSDTGATYLDQAIVAMQRFGLCPENRLSHQGRKKHPAWSVKDTSKIEQQLSHHWLQDRAYYYWRPSIDDLFDPMPFDIDLVAQLIWRLDIPISISMPIYPDGDILPWSFGVGADTGVIPEPLANWQETPIDKLSGHSVCLVGAVEDETAPGGGWFIFRNSWGPDFAARRTEVKALKDILHPGYGALSFAHVQQHCWEMALIAPSL